MRRTLLLQSISTVPALLAICVSSSFGQLPFQETFTDDGDGTRYTMIGRGSLDTPDGPAMWEHNSQVNQIGTVSAAPAKRAAILWTHNVLFSEDFSDEAFQVWANLTNWALDGKQNATIGFAPGYDNIDFNSVFALGEMFEDQGHTLIEIPTVDDLPDPADVDLIIHSSEASAETILGNAAGFIEYAVPIISFNAGNHDDTAIAQTSGTVQFMAAVELGVVAENANHAILDGIPNPVPWGDFLDPVDLQGIGNSPPGGEVLLTYTDPASGATGNALLVIEEGGGLLGSFGPVSPDGGFIVGASLDDFPEGDFGFTRVLEINPVDVSDATEDVMLTVSLAATRADYEAGDFLRILVGEPGDFPEDFIALSDPASSEFFGADAIAGTDPCFKALSNDGGATCLPSTEFVDHTWNVTQAAPDITDLVVRIEAISSFPNEVVAIDEIRLTAGDDPEPMQQGDYDGDGFVGQGDIDLVLLNWGSDVSGGAPNGWTSNLPMGSVDQDELDAVLLNWGQGQQLGAAGVPEPGSLAMLLVAAGLALAGLRQKR